MNEPNVYILVDGSSFSAPLVAGAAALIKSARPGLTVAQYRSLLINTAAATMTATGHSPGVQEGGAGILAALAALRAPVTASPTSLRFGAGGGEFLGGLSTVPAQ